MEDAGLAEAERGAVVARLGAAAAGLDPDQPDLLVVDEPGEQAGRVRPAADTGHGQVGSRPSASMIWARASSPMTRWNSRTMSG